MKYILFEILRGHLLVIFIVLSSYLIELNSRWKLIITVATLKKNYAMARGSSGFHAIIYFIVNLVVLMYDNHSRTELPESYSFWKWLVVMVPLTVIFRMVYYRLTPKDPDREDFDFSE